MVTHRQTICAARQTEQVQALTDAWLRLPYHERIDFQSYHPELHATVSRLTAHHLAERTTTTKETHMFTRAFLIASLERALKTFAQTLAAALVIGATGVLDADWTVALSTAGLATVLSFLTSIASAGVGGTGPSLANEVTSPPAPMNEGI